MELKQLQREGLGLRPGSRRPDAAAAGIPAFPRPRGRRLRGADPALPRQVGGDFYDAFFIDQTRLLGTIGDVCGKGMPAALLMVRAVTLRS